MNKKRHIIERDTPFLMMMTDYVIPSVLIGVMVFVGVAEFLKQLGET